MSSNFINRMLGTSDGTTGITPVGADGQPVRNSSDRFGRLWVKLFQGSAPVDAVNPLAVGVQTSVLPIGAATEATLATIATNTGSTTTALGNISTEATLLSVDAEVTAAAAVLGTTTDAVDRIGGTTTINAKLRGLTQMASNSAAAVPGFIVRGNTLSDGAITGSHDYPVRGGGRARAITNLPTAVTSDRVVGATYSLQGEAFVALSTPIAGEDRTNNVLNVWERGQSISTGWTNTHSNSATTQQHNFITGAGNLRDVRGLNLSAQPLYLFICSKGTTLVNGDAPLFAPYPVPPGGYISDDFGSTGIRSGVGFRAGWSTTPTTLTLVNGGPISGQVA